MSIRYNSFWQKSPFLLVILREKRYTRRMKIWIRTTNGDKTLKSTTCEISAITQASLTEALRETLFPLDVPTPIVLPQHANHLKSFNIVRFSPSDFIESVDFTALVIELHREKKEKKVVYY